MTKSDDFSEEATENSSARISRTFKKPVQHGLGSDDLICQEGKSQAAVDRALDSKAFMGWIEVDNPWTHEDETDNSELTYLNLQLNPERYTGYTGPSARRIWDAIYSENCLNNWSIKKFFTSLGLSFSPLSVCGVFLISVGVRLHHLVYIAVLPFHVQIRKNFGLQVEAFFVLLTAIQFHVMFYCTCLLPNILAFGLGWEKLEIVEYIGGTN
ncbi:hypothetical protein OROHE_013033 [Orobanche hederae]